MRRYEGFLRPSVKPAPWPARWVIVSTEGSPRPVEGRSKLRETGLSQWHASLLTTHAGKLSISASWAGADASGLWSLLTEIAAKPGPSWCLSVRALYDWTLLGLWERLELGTIALQQVRAKRLPLNPFRGTGRDSPMLLAGDPPSAAHLLLGEGRHKLTWVCARNYGWRIEGGSGSGAEAVRRLGAAVASASFLLGKYHLGGWGITPGAMALRAWRASYLEESVHVTNDHDSMSLADAAGSGGRVVALRAAGGREDCYALDARGLYPHLGVGAELPVRLLHRFRSAVRARDSVRKDPRRHCARVRLRTGEPKYPRRERGRTDYPLGDFVTVLAGPELEEAIKDNSCLEILEAQEYACETVLADFHCAAYSMRCEAESRGEACAASLAKGLAVSLVGKLAQRVQLWEECTPDYDDKMWGEWWGADPEGNPVQYRSLAGQVSRLRAGGYAPTAVPMIPAWIWSLGRLWLWERMACAGHEEVMYADTDGLIVSAQGHEKLRAAGYIRDNEWGELRHVIGPAKCVVHGPKCVEIGDRIIQAGAPAEQRKAFAETPGYWFRKGFKRDPESWLEAKWVEEWRDYEGGNRGE